MKACNQIEIAGCFDISKCECVPSPTDVMSTPGERDPTIRHIEASGLVRLTNGINRKRIRFNCVHTRRICFRTSVSLPDLRVRRQQHALEPDSNDGEPYTVPHMCRRPVTIQRPSCNEGCAIAYRRRENRPAYRLLARSDEYVHLPRCI